MKTMQKKHNEQYRKKNKTTVIHTTGTNEKKHFNLDCILFHIFWFF